MVRGGQGLCAALLALAALALTSGRPFADDADRAKPLFGEAWRLAGAGNHRAAVEKYQAGIALLPDSSAARYHLAKSLEAVGRDGEAILEYCRAARLAPDTEEGKQAIAHLRLPVDAGIGNGRTNFSDKSSYAGEMLNGKVHGCGTQNYADGSILRSVFRGGKIHGRGAVIYANGDRYVGDWNSGDMTGRGVYVNENGNSYDGEMRRGLRHGQGTLKWGFNRYIGAWKDDRPDGYGEIFFAVENAWFKGQWTNGCFRDANGRPFGIGRPHSECP